MLRVKLDVGERGGEQRFELLRVQLGDVMGVVHLIAPGTGVDIARSPPGRRTRLISASTCSWSLTCSIASKQTT